ncbi:helix-turn-helix domain-containing protein [Lentzea sp. NPDC005914]|uniref:helix-turn-helix domain-containing protein n=1 Tax=Lentzea sp. NPDC005914 TaxID=3154572 RepID=UPI0033DC3BB4
MTPTPLVEAAARLANATQEFGNALASMITIVVFEWSKSRTNSPQTLPPPQAAPTSKTEQPRSRTAWTVDELSESTALNRSTIYRLIQSGEIRAIRVNKGYRIAETERIRWFEEQERRLAADLGIVER